MAVESHGNVKRLKRITSPSRVGGCGDDYNTDKMNKVMTIMTTRVMMKTMMITLSVV